MIKNNLSTILGSRLLSISDLHTDTGIARSTLYSIYYRKTKGVSLSTLIKICDSLRLPLSDVIEYIPETKEDGEDNGNNGTAL